MKLLSILRLADALDSGPDANVHIRRLLVKKKSIAIFYSGHNLTGLEAIRVERQKQLFEEVFKRSVTVFRGA